MLVNSLSAHPNIRCHHEPFNQNGWHEELKDFSQPIDALNYLDSNSLSISMAKKISSAIQNKLGVHRGSLVIDPFKQQSKIAAQGFKVTWAQASMMLGDVTEWLANKEDMQCIFLYRADYLARFVSYQVAQAKRLWNSSYRTHTIEPFSVSPIEFRAFCDKEVRLEETLWRMLAETNTRASLLSYEALAENPLDAVNTQVNFLGCDGLSSLRAVTTKLVATPLEELILNFDELDSRKVNGLAEEKRHGRLQQAV